MWYDQGGSSDFAFTPFTNSMLEVGLAARRTLASIHGKVMWVATDRRVWIGGGQSGQPMSPGWVDLLLQQIDLQKLTAYMYAQGGDEFYVLTYEGSTAGTPTTRLVAEELSTVISNASPTTIPPWTIEVSLATASWVYRQTAGRTDHAGRCGLEHNNGICYVGLDTGEVCTVDLTTASEPAGVMPRKILTMWLGTQEAHHVVNTIDVTSYMGPEAGNFSLDWSEDRGINWRGQRTITWPSPGKRRSIARALGSSRRRQVRISYQGSKAPFEMDEFFIQVSEGS
jgi:hypothetical protein